MQHQNSSSAKPYSSSSSNFRRNRIVLVCLVIMAVMSWFCAMTPWISDDYAFSKNGAGLWTTQIKEYMEWSGKFIGHFMSRALLSGPGWLHPVLTPIMFMLLVAGGTLSHCLLVNRTF